LVNAYRHLGKGYSSPCLVYHPFLEVLDRSHVKEICDKTTIVHEAIAKLGILQEDKYETFIVQLTKFTGGIPRVLECVLKILSKADAAVFSFTWWMNQLVCDSEFCETFRTNFASLLEFPDCSVQEQRQLKRALYKVLFSKQFYDKELVQLDGKVVNIIDLLNMFNIFQTGKGVYVIPDALFNTYKPSLGLILSSCIVTDPAKSWENICCITLANHWKTLLEYFADSEHKNLFNWDHLYEFSESLALEFPKVEIPGNKKNLKRTQVTQESVTQFLNDHRAMKSILFSEVNDFLKYANFPASGAICKFGNESMFADGLIDIGTKKLVIALIAKCYQPDSVKSKFTPKLLTDELAKLKTLTVEPQQYENVLGVFMAPILSNTFAKGTGKIFTSSNGTHNKKTPQVHKLGQSTFTVPDRVMLVIIAPEEIERCIGHHFTQFTDPGWLP